MFMFRHNTGRLGASLVCLVALASVACSSEAPGPAPTGGTGGSGADTGAGGTPSTGGTAGAGGTAATGGIDPSQVTMIADFEDGLSEGWETFGDESGVQSVSVEQIPSDDGTKQALFWSASGFTKWGANLGYPIAAPGEGLDASAFTGLYMRAKIVINGFGSLRVALPDANTDPGGGICSEVTCFGHWSVELSKTEGFQVFTLPFSAFKQVLSEGQAAADSLVTSELYKISFLIGASTADYGVEVHIDEIGFY